MDGRAVRCLLLVDSVAFERASTWSWLWPGVRLGLVWFALIRFGLDGGGR